MGLGILTHSYESPPTRCPVCRYSLEGLPEEHRCPECGEAYDAQTHVWFIGLHQFMSVALLIFAVGIAAMYLAIFLDLAQNGWTWAGGIDRLRPVLIMTFGCLVAFSLLWGERAIGVGPKGLVLVEYWKTRRFAWEEIEHITWQEKPWFAIQLTNGRVRRIKNQVFYNDKSLVEQIVRKANERLESIMGNSTELSSSDAATAASDGA